MAMLDGPHSGSIIGSLGRLTSFRIILCGMLFALSGSGLFAQEPPAKTDATETDDARSFANRYVTLFRERAQLQAETEFLKEEIDRLTGQGTEYFDGDLFEDFSEIEPATQSLLASLMERNAQPFVKGLERAQRQVDDESQKLEESWKAVRADVNAGHALLFDVKSQRQVAGRLASLLNVDNRWLWLCGAVAACTLLAVFLQERRHYLRRQMQVRRTRFLSLIVLLSVCIAVPLLPTILIFLLGNQTYDSLVSLGPAGTQSPRKRMANETAELATEVEALKRPHSDTVNKYERAREAYQNRLLERTKADPELANRWSTSRKDLKTLAVALAVRQALTEQLKSDLTELEKVNQERAEHEESIAAYEGIKRFTGAGLGVVLLSAIGGLGLVFVRRVQRRQKQIANTCPRCLAENKLERVTNPNATGIVEYRCTNIIRENPFEECDFQFNAHYHDRTKISFPTLGVAESGKTHWLAMVYRQLNLGAFPEQVHFEKVNTKGSKEFDLLVERILTNRMKVSATTGNHLPHPLIFGFQDHDRFGKSNVLVNLFDYAGAIIAARTIEDFHRRRALDGDGFFFFLDPTMPSEAQAEALVNFREDLRIVKKLGTGKQIHTPVALCITKIDLFVNQPYAQGDVITDFYEQLSKIDEEEEPLSQRLIERRSELVQQLRETIWPGWQIERQIQDLFGSRYMFFPFTPVGLNELGETDLSRRTISPYGILEPLLWLLHMNGYPVLD